MTLPGEQIFHHLVVLIIQVESEDLVLWVMRKHNLHFISAHTGQVLHTQPLAIKVKGRETRHAGSGE